MIRPSVCGTGTLEEESREKQFMNVEVQMVDNLRVSANLTVREKVLARKIPVESVLKAEGGNKGLFSPGDLQERQSSEALTKSNFD